jgi:carbonic anhydrase
LSSVSATDSLDRLREGNDRFVGGRRTASEQPIADAQDPFAVVLACSDSRVPVELVFDQGFGDLFVIRVAGNVVAPSLVGSVEFAVDRFDVRLVVVLGHSGCGAVDATLEALRRPSGDLSPNLRDIIERIRPSVEPLLKDGDVSMEQAVRANIRASVGALRDTDLLAQTSDLEIVGAEYDLATGRVAFLDG